MDFSSGFIDCGASGSLCLRLSGMATYRGDFRCFPVLGEVCKSIQIGPPGLVNSSCLLNRGVVRIGGIRGNRDEDATGGEGSVFGESSFCFPTIGGGWNSCHSGGVGLSFGKVLKSGCLGNRDLV